MTSEKKGRKGGRKANLWSLVNFATIAAHLKETGTSQTAFAKAVGVTSSTFHNWKTGRCAPDEETQGKIVATIEGKEVPVAKKKKTKKITKVTARGSRGSGSSTLAALGEGGPAVAKKVKKIKKKIKKAEAKAPAVTVQTAKPVKQVKRRVRGVVRTAPATNGSGPLEDWKNLEALAEFLKANEGRTADDVKSAIDKINEAWKLAELFA